MKDRRKISFYMILILLGVYSNQGYSQQKNISLEEAVSLALNNNVNILKSQNNYQEAENTLLTSYIDLLPKAELYSDGYRSIGNTFDELTGQLRTNSGEFVNTNLTISWDILEVFQKYSNLKYSKNNKEFNFWRLETVKDDTVLNVIKLYLEILQNEDQGKILEEFIKVQKSNLEQTDEMIKLGVLAGQDHFSQKVELSRLKSAQIENINIINRKKNLLLLLLGMNTDTKMGLVTRELPVEQFEYLKDTSIDTLYLNAIKERNDIKSKEFELKSIKNQLNIQRSNYYPDINMFYRHGTGYSSFRDNTFNDQFFSDNIYKAYGVQVVIPILNGNRTRNNVYKSKIAYETAKLDYKQYRNTVYTELSNTKNDLELGMQELAYREDQLEFSKRNYNLVKEKYFLQATSSQELIVAYRNYIEAELRVSQINYQLIFNYYQMQNNLGELRDLFR